MFHPIHTGCCIHVTNTSWVLDVGHTRDILKYTVSTQKSAVFSSHKWFHLSETITDIPLCVHSMDEVYFSRKEYFWECHLPVNPEEHRLEIVFSDDWDASSNSYTETQDNANSLESSDEATS